MFLITLLVVSTSSPLTEPAREGPSPIISLTGAVFTGIPDFVGVSVVVRAIPFVDIEALASTWLLQGTVAGVRAGPRFMLEDWRDEANHGWTLHLSGLGGVRHLTSFWSASENSLNLVAAFDATLWFSRHFGLALRLNAGAIYVLGRDSLTFTARLFPDVRAAVGVAF